ncbi:MAG: amidohydrolase family protein [Pseudomonadales bacterium]
MDIVDSQIHFGPGGIDEVLAEMDTLGIQACLVDEFWGLETWGPGYSLPNGTFRPTRPTVELAAALHPDRFAYVARVERTDPEVLSLIRIAADDPNARAIRLIPAVTAAEVEAFSSGDYDDIFAVANHSGMPVFLFIAGYVELMPRYLQKYPQVRFIVDHCGMPMEAGIGMLDEDTPGGSSHPGPDVPYFDKVLELADYPNVALKWSHAQGMFGELEYPSPGLIPHLHRAIDAFGVQRIMWASDHGGNQTGETWEQLVHYLLDSDGVSQEEKAWLFGKTVRAMLSWPIPH